MIFGQFDSARSHILFKGGETNRNIMPLPEGYTVPARKRSKFHPVPSDRYQVQITDINLVNELNPFSNKEEDRLNFEFTILDDKKFQYVDDENNPQEETVRGRKLWRRISPSNSPATKKSKASLLYKLLCAVEGKELREEELADLMPASLVGQQVVVMVEETEKGYNNILSFSHADKDLEPVPAKEEVSDEDAEVIATAIETGNVDGVKKK